MKINENEAETKIFKPEVILGRSKSCDYIVDDPSVSREHASIGINENGYYIFTKAGQNLTQIIRKGQIIKVTFEKISILPEDILCLGRSKPFAVRLVIDKVFGGRAAITPISSSLPGLAPSGGDGFSGKFTPSIDNLNSLAKTKCRCANCMGIIPSSWTGNCPHCGNRIKA